MRIWLILPILLLSSGCSITRRLDGMQGQLRTITEQLDEANCRLSNVEQATASFPKVGMQLEEANRKLSSVDEAAKRLVKILPPLESLPKKR